MQCKSSQYVFMYHVESKSSYHLLLAYGFYIFAKGKALLKLTIYAGTYMQ